MTEMVCSVVVQEALSQALSGLKDRCDGRSSVKEHMERMEMAQIKLEAALDTSDKWDVSSSVPLQRWRNKLKRAAQECDDTLRRCKQRIREEEIVSDSSFPKRMAHTAKSFISSILALGGGGGNDELSIRSAVRRFEWFAESAREFISFVKHGGTPCTRCMFFDPLVRHLLAGKGVEHSFVHGEHQHLLFFLRPVHTPEHGIEGRMTFILLDGQSPRNNFILGFNQRLYESTDVVGVVVRCLQLFTPHQLGSTAEIVKTKLTHLPTQDFSWEPYADSSPINVHWNSLHTILCKCFRPNPSCCHDHRSSESSLSPSSATYLEPVTKVYLLGYVPLPSSASQCHLTRFDYLKVGVLFSPHASYSEDISSPAAAAGGSATETINNDTGESKCTLYYANMSFQQMREVMLPKAVECLRQNAGATMYQMLWRSNHGAAYIRVDKTSATAQQARSVISRKHRGTNQVKHHINKSVIWRRRVLEFIGSWVVHAPVKQQGFILEWIHKEKEMQSALK